MRVGSRRIIVNRRVPRPIITASQVSRRFSNVFMRWFFAGSHDTFGHLVYFSENSREKTNWPSCFSQVALGTSASVQPISSRVGIESAAPGRVTEMAAAWLPITSASLTDPLPNNSARKKPMKLSPAAVVSTAST
jgi:hypothetical protein